VTNNQKKKMIGIIIKWSIMTIVSLFSLSSLPAPLQAEDKKPAFTLRDWITKDAEVKRTLVQGYIDVAKDHKVIIRLQAEHYCKEIDSLVQRMMKNGDEAGLDASVGTVIKTIAVMEGDWDNGKNKLEYAKKFMGPAMFEDFMKQYPEKYNKLLKESENNR
jgi:hypothetical protein